MPLTTRLVFPRRETGSDFEGSRIVRPGLARSSTDKYLPTLVYLHLREQLFFGIIIEIGEAIIFVQNS